MSDDTVHVESWRDVVQARTLRKALQKRADGVPTYSVPEVAALLSEPLPTCWTGRLWPLRRGVTSNG